jgi:hypothetical protein
MKDVTPGRADKIEGGRDQLPVVWIKNVTQGSERMSSGTAFWFPEISKFCP